MQSIYMGKPKPVQTAAPFRWERPPTADELLRRLAASSKRLDLNLLSMTLAAAKRASDIRVAELLAKPKPKRRTRPAFPRWDD